MLSKQILTGIMIAGLLGLQGCSETQEDPRIGFCRGMASDLTGTDVAAWRHAGDRIVEPEFAEVTVGNGDRKVSCFYAYDAVEPGAMEHATPLLAFSTLPYEVHVGERVLKGAALTKAVEHQQRRWNRALFDKAKSTIDRARQGVEQAAEVAKDKLEQMDRQAR